VRGINKLILIGAALSQISTSAKPFRIAALYSQGRLDYSIDTYGPEAICITQAAIKDAQKHGMDVSLEIVDSQWSAVQTSKAAAQVVRGKYDAAVGTIASAEALVASQVLNEAKIPFIAPTATHPGVTKGKSYVVRVLFNDYRQASLLAKLTATELRPKKIAVVRNISNPYSDFISKRFSEDMGLLAPTVPILDFPIIDNFNGFKQLVTKIVIEKPDLIFLPLWEPQVASVYAELVQAKAKMTVLASDTIDGKEGFIKFLQPMPDSLPFIFSSYWDGKLDGPRGEVYQRLHDAYCKQDPPSRVSAAAFDAISLILEAIRADPKIKKAQLVQKIKALNYVGLTGPMRFDSDGDPMKPIELYTIKDGKSVHWKRYE
jgi:branched-chain amino acid transport system substrate-binding protein